VEELHSPELYSDEVVMISAPKGLAAPKLLPPGLNTCPYVPVAEKIDRDEPTVLSALVDHRGYPVDISVSSSSGSDDLDRVALRCLSEAHFRPAMQGGSNVPVEIQVIWRWRPVRVQECSPAMWVKWNVAVEMTPSRAATDNPPDTAESVVCICGKETGEVADPVIVRSSGIARIDEAALNLAKRAGKPWSGHAGCEASRFKFTKRSALPGDRN
jgi:TonB family protein